MAADKRDPKIAEKCQRLARLGLRDSDIAVIVELSERTMQRRYKPELAKGRVEGKEEIADNLMAMAKSKKFPAINIFLAKVKLGYKDEGDGEKKEDRPPQIIVQVMPKPDA